MAHPISVPIPRRITVAAEQVGRLIRDQFPQWADQPVLPVARSGWDDITFQLGDEMPVRLPTASEYALAVDGEHRWLPALAPRLPLSIPVPLAKGRPGAGYPFPWSVYRWLDGEPADRSAGPVRCARDLAEFLAALQGVDTGNLGAVIDFGTCGVCDLAIAWTLLTAEDGRCSGRACPWTTRPGHAGVVGHCGRRRDRFVIWWTCGAGHGRRSLTASRPRACGAPRRTGWWR
ncbi:hypothetical protein GCM10029964_065190 [Kibdelosporangium lantanae]